MRLRVHFKEEQDFKVDLKQSNTVLHSDFGEITTITESDYNNLTNKPSINGVELIGNKTGEDLDLGSAVFPQGGQPGDFLGLDDDSEVAWITPEPATIDYNDLQNQPQINGVTLSRDKSAQELGLATPSDIPSLEPYRTAADQDAIDIAQDLEIDSKYVKPNDGIPLSDLSSSVQASLSAADSAYILPDEGIPASDLSAAVQSNLSLAGSALQPSSVDSALSENSINPVQNKVITSALNEISVSGLPSGGTQGQLLMKSSNTDYMTEWISPANSVEQDNTRPITAAAVYTEVGNIHAILAII